MAKSAPMRLTCFAMQNCIAYLENNLDGQNAKEWCNSWIHITWILGGR